MHAYAATPDISRTSVERLENYLAGGIVGQRVVERTEDGHVAGDDRGEVCLDWRKRLGER